MIEVTEKINGEIIKITNIKCEKCSQMNTYIQPIKLIPNNQVQEVAQLLKKQKIYLVKPITIKAYKLKPVAKNLTQYHEIKEI